MSKKAISLSRQNKKWILPAGIALGIFVILGVTFLVSRKFQEQEEVIYKEKTVTKGVMESGVTVRGSVDIGTIEQTFELDMSALQRVSKSSSSSSSSKSQGSGMGSMSGMSGMGSMGGTSGGMNPFSQTMNITGGTTYTKSGDSSSLTIKEVCVSVGQEIKKGDVLYVLEEDTVQKLKETLESDVDKAKADLDMVYADQKTSKQTAQNTYEQNLAYGDYMQTEYNETIAELEDAVKEAKSTLNQAKETLAEYQASYEETKTAYDKAAQVLENCEWSRDNTDKNSNVYLYVYYFQLAQQAQSTADQLKQKVEQLESRMESAKKTVSRAEKSLNQANRRLEQGKLDAEETLKLRQLAYDTAQENYDVTIAYLEAEAKEQEETYADAKEKWDSFSAYIDGCNICSLYDGTVTSVELAVGDSVDTNSLLVTINTRNNVTMTVTVDEDDLTGITVGTKANVTLTAFPDDVFEATVTEISEAQSDRSGNVTYEVTATMSGELSQLYQSMTGEITFVTGKTEEEVLYVPKRAITTDGEKSTVNVRKADGSIESRTVVTGFSDGVNVEIKEGLAEGETVITESRVKGK